LEWFLVRDAAALRTASHLLIYNSGSVLNPVEMAEAVLDAIAAQCRNTPSVRVVSVESREGYVTVSHVEHLLERLASHQVLRVVIGLESADDRIRDGLLDKKMPRFAVERAFEALAAVARRLPGRVGLDVNLLLAPPGTEGQSAVEDAARSARFALEAGKRWGFAVDLNLHPFYPSARSLSRFPDHGRCSPQVLAAAAAAVERQRAALKCDAGIYIGLEDEGHDQGAPDEANHALKVRAAVDRFNVTARIQDLAPLR
jgi:radical SAM enzyme (TIGR01210 family)